MGKAATVQARVEPYLKEQSEKVFKKLGLSASQVINALYAQVVLQQGLPFELKLPNKTTRDAIAELEAGKGKRFSSIQDMMNDLDNDDA